jgi:ribosomal protein L31E
MAPRSRAEDIVSREYTINVHKRIHRIQFKKRAPRAIKEIKKFATQAMGTEDVRIGTDLNKYIWSKGVRNVPCQFQRPHSCVVCVCVLLFDPHPPPNFIADDQPLAMHHQQTGLTPTW